VLKWSSYQSEDPLECCKDPWKTLNDPSAEIPFLFFTVGNRKLSVTLYSQISLDFEFMWANDPCKIVSEIQWGTLYVCESVIFWLHHPIVCLLTHCITLLLLLFIYLLLLLLLLGTRISRFCHPESLPNYITLAYEWVER